MWQPVREWRFGTGGHLSIIDRLVIQKHAIVYMYVVSRSTLCVKIKCKFLDKVRKIWLLEKVQILRHVLRK